MILPCAAALWLATSGLAGDFDSGQPARSLPAERAVQALSGLSKEDLLQLRKLYQRYADVVQKRREDDDWRYGLESGEIIEHPEEARLPARQIEEAAAKREAEIKKLTAQRQKAEGDEAARLDFALEARQSELKKLRRQLSKTIGTSADWSDAVWAELLKVGADDWDLRDGPRRARPWHTAAIACAPAGAETPAVCLAFDPWKTGEPAVYDFISWDDGSFEGRIAPEFFLHHLPEPEGS